MFGEQLQHSLFDWVEVRIVLARKNFVKIEGDLCEPQMNADKRRSESVFVCGWSLKRFAEAADLRGVVVGVRGVDL